VIKARPKATAGNVFMQATPEGKRPRHDVRNAHGDSAGDDRPACRDYRVALQRE
jgi:hypothetical protein